ncbi:MAG: nucleotidyltransferase domain-containing protein [bacterium]
MKKDIKGIFHATNPLKVLSFLVDNPTKDFQGKEIQQATRISRTGVYLALRGLVRSKLACEIRRGKFFAYSAACDNAVVKQFKVLKNLILLNTALSRLQPFSKKIVLYGSASRGEDDSNSDIDLFVLSHSPGAAKEAIASLRMKRKIQAVVKTPVELHELKEKDRVFWGEVERGIVLWEEQG